MRQAGVIAAAGLVALEKGPSRLHEDHAKAKLLAKRLSVIPGLKIDPDEVQTNIVIFDISGTGLDSNGYLEDLQRNGVLAVPVDINRVRMVTHLDVSSDEIKRAAEIVTNMHGSRLE